MINYIRTKKKLIVSYKNLTDDLRALFKEAYPDGYQEYLQKAVTPKGEPIFLVPLETDDTSYMIKFDVKVDTLHAEDLEKEMFDGDDKSGDDDFNAIDEVMEKDEDMSGNHTERVLNHGSYEGVMDDMTGSKKKKQSSELDELRQELEAEFGGDDDDDDEYKDDFKDDLDDDEDDYEPTADDLAEIDSMLEGEMETSKPAKGKKTAAKTSTSKKATASTAKKTATTKKTTTTKKASATATAKKSSSTSKAKTATTAKKPAATKKTTASASKKTSK